MFVTFVQGIVRAFDEHLPPLYQTGGQEPRDHADNDLLEESGMHNQH